MAAQLAGSLRATSVTGPLGTAEVGMAPLRFRRPIFEFEPSPASYAPAQALWQRGRDELRTAVHKRQLTTAADSDAAIRILTTAVAGGCSQQLANQPGARFEEGLFTSLTDEVLDMLATYCSPPESKARRMTQNPTADTVERFIEASPELLYDISPTYPAMPVTGADRYDVRFSARNGPPARATGTGSVP